MGEGKDQEEKGFVVKDKRFSAQKETEEEPSIKAEAKKEEPSQGAPLPEIDFFSFVLSLSTSAFIQLGVVQDPVTKQSAKDLPLAKHTIDLIGMLKEKTKGNLTSEEEKLVDNVLYDLRMRYVKLSG